MVPRVGPSLVSVWYEGGDLGVGDVFGSVVCVPGKMLLGGRVGESSEGGEVS